MYIPEDARVWGYLPLTENSDNAFYQPDPDSPFDPLVLHIIGTGKLNIPHSLRDIVRIHQDLDYSSYYELMQSIDVCLPAFSEDSCGHFSRQLSRLRITPTN